MGVYLLSSGGGETLTGGTQTGAGQRESISVLGEGRKRTRARGDLFPRRKASEENRCPAEEGFRKRRRSGRCRRLEAADEGGKGKGEGILRGRRSEAEHGGGGREQAIVSEVKGTSSGEGKRRRKKANRQRVVARPSDPEKKENLLGKGGTKKGQTRL